MHFWPHFFIVPQVKSQVPPAQVAVPPAGAVQAVHADPQCAGESSTQLPEQRCCGELQVGPDFPPAPPGPLPDGGPPPAPPELVEPLPPVPIDPLLPLPPDVPAAASAVPPLPTPPLPLVP